MAKRTKLIKWSTTVTWSEIELLLVADAYTLIRILMRLRTDTLITARSLNATFGITDGPILERIFFLVTDLDEAQLPLVVTDQNVGEAILENALWVDNEFWASIGTDAGPIKLDDEAVSVKLNRKYGGAGLTPPSAIVAVVKSDTTSRIIYTGQLLLDVAYQQTSYNNDNAMFNQSPVELGV